MRVLAFQFEVIDAPGVSEDSDNVQLPNEYHNLRGLRGPLCRRSHWRTRDPRDKTVQRLGEEELESEEAL